MCNTRNKFQTKVVEIHEKKNYSIVILFLISFELNLTFIFKYYVSIIEGRVFVLVILDHRGEMGSLDDDYVIGSYLIVQLIFQSIYLYDLKCFSYILEMPHDYFCSKVKLQLSNQTCKTCGLYDIFIKSLNRHIEEIHKKSKHVHWWEIQICKSRCSLCK